MISEGSDASRALAVSEVASRLFGTPIGPDAVIDESLRRATNDRLVLPDVVPNLADVLKKDLPDQLTDAELFNHPLAIWVELALGLEDGQVLQRRRPYPSATPLDCLLKPAG